jgi:AP-2 complex subunit alpha
MGRQGFQEIVPLIIKILIRINDHSQDYFYYMTPCPWLQIKCLKIL